MNNNASSDDGSLVKDGNVRFGPSETTTPLSVRNLLASSSSNHHETGSITYQFQHQLPRLPIPTLSETLDKLQHVVLKALLTDEEMKQAEHDIHEFQNGLGPVLQEALVQYDEECAASGEIGSYVEEFWNESYLAYDASVVLNLNPYFVLEDGPDPKVAHDQLKRAASLCFAASKVASALRHETLEPDTIKGKPLCMDQFKVLFGASRQPSSQSSDDVHVYSDSCHVAVLCNNQFYYFPVLWPMTGHVAVDEGDILEILRAIERHAMETSPEEASQEALGVFTSLPRAQWAAARQELIDTSDGANQNALTLIDSALFVLVLDSYAPETIHDAAANMLHGTNQLASGETAQVGTCLNRWYDKLQIIVLADGTSGINFEHSSIDGHTALRFVSDVFAETVISFAESIVDVIHGRGRIQHVVEAVVDRAAVYAEQTDRPVLGVAPKKIVFQMTEQLRKRIYFAETALCDELCASDTYVLEFRDYGKSLIVGNKMSPDSFTQMSMLLAYYKLYGKVVCMYEPVLTKAFYHGRTEAMRSATPLAKTLCEVWCNAESTNERKLSALRAAVSEHANLVKESATGKGVDRHLYSLKCIAKRSGLPIPAFFDSIAWNTLNHTILSTSNCGNPSLRLFGFGPVVSDGFGVGYIIKDHGLTYSVSSKHRQTQRYVRSLATTLKELQTLLLPLSNIQVHKKRTALVEIKDLTKGATRLLDRQESSAISEYPDIWGERSAPSTTDQKVDASPAALPSKSKPFFSVVARQHSFDLLSKIDRHNSLVDF